MKRTIKKAQSQSVEEAFKIFILEKEASGRAKDTIRDYQLSFKLFLQDMNVSTFDEISEELINAWIILMKSNGKTANTIAHYVRDIRCFLFWSSENNYMNEIKINNIKEQKPLMKLYSDDELALLTKPPVNKDDFVEYRTWVIIALMLSLGSRAATVCNLMIDDIDFKNNDVYYRHLKSKEIAVLPLPTALAKILRNYLSDWQRETDSRYLFCDIGERQLSTNALYQAFDNYCKDRGVKCRGVHTLRHNFARGWIINGGDAFSLQKMLCHSTLDMTRRYVTLFDKDLHKNIDDYSLFGQINNSGSRTKIIKKK